MINDLQQIPACLLVFCSFFFFHKISEVEAHQYLMLVVLVTFSYVLSVIYSPLSYYYYLPNRLEFHTGDWTTTQAGTCIAN